MRKIVIIGTGDTAQDAKIFVEKYNLYEIAGYACSEQYVDKARKQMPLENICSIDDLGGVYDKAEVELFVAVSHFYYLNRDRKEIFERLKSDGWHFARLISPTAIIYNSEIGEGCWISDRVYIGMNANVGENTFLSNDVYVTHYCKIGSHNFIAGGTMLGGNVVVGNQCFFGIRSLVFNNINIGNKCIIGAAAIVKNHIPDCTMVMIKDNAISQTFSEEEIEYKHIPPQLEKSITDGHERTEIIKNEETKKYFANIYSYLTKQYPATDFKNQTGLMSSHVLDSVAIISLIAFLEEEYRIIVPYYEISASNFNSIDAICSLVDRIVRSQSCNSEKKLPQIGDVSDDYTVEPQKTLIEYVKKHAEFNPHKTAVISAAGEYSYGDLYKYVRKYAAFLESKGVRKADRIVVKACQSVDYIIVYLATHFLGATITTVEKNTPNPRIMDLAKEIEAACVVCDSNNQIESTVIFADSTRIFESLDDMEEKNEDFPDGNGSADILFTTGTTGKAKGVELSHSAIVAGAENIAFGCEMKRDTVLIVPNPLSHSNAIKNMAACFITGCTFYVLDGITDLKAYFDALDYPYGKVATVLPPAAIRTLFQLAKEKLASYINTLDYLMAATAPLLEPDRDELRKLLPNTRLYNHYGCSESSSICIYDFNKYSELKNCVGRSMPHSRVFFVDEERKEIESSINSIGFLAVEGDAAMKGYFREPELTDQIKNGQIIYTKDMGYLDENGFVYVLGRNDDIINVGGLKVSPLDVETAALSYPGVVDCICIGVNDEITGRALKLLVVSGSGFNMESLKACLASKLDAYKIPRSVELVTKVERTYNGKLNRKAYR